MAGPMLSRCKLIMKQRPSVCIKIVASLLNAKVGANNVSQTWSKAREKKIHALVSIQSKAGICTLCNLHWPFALSFFEYTYANLYSWLIPKTAMGLTWSYKYLEIQTFYDRNLRLYSCNDKKITYRMILEQYITTVERV